MYEIIFALLEKTFQGTRQDGLKQLARTLALTVDTEEKAKEDVGKITADQVKQFITDWRKDADSEITKANQTFEAGLRNKYDFKEKGRQDPPPTSDPDKDKPLTMADVQKIVEDAVAKATEGVTSQVSAIQTATLTADRKAKLEAVFGEGVPDSYKKAVLYGFEGRTFADDNDFNEYLNRTKADLAEFTTELSNRGLSLQGKPAMGAQNPKTGVSAAVESYLKAKSVKEGGQGKPLAGKEV